MGTTTSKRSVVRDVLKLVRGAGKGKIMPFYFSGGENLTLNSGN